MNDSIFDPQAQLHRQDFKIIASLERLNEAFRVLLWEQAKIHGISPIQIQILVFLHFHREANRKVSYLAQEFNLTKATVSEAVKSLEQKELLQRQPDTSDTRSHTLHLTALGTEVAQKTALFANPMLQALSRLSIDQQSNLLEHLLGIIALLQQAGIISMQRMCFSCRFYQKNGAEHFCRFLNASLKNSELRLDCPEFEPAELK